MGTITALEVQKRNKQRVNLYIDDEFAFGISLIEAAKLRKGQVLSEAEIAALRGEDAVLQAVDRAANFLSFRPRSAQEVRRNLAEKDMPPEIIEAALTRLTAMGYVDDDAFARYWAQNRGEFKPLSKKALRYELKQKGVADSVIDEALDSLDETEQAYKAAQSQTRKLRRLNRRDFRTKLAAFLQRRGFSYSTTREVVDRLCDELEAEDPAYFNLDTTDDEE
ncbi:MAG: RecX family transcriptional regulator [Anaerolineae bacterium]|nr:RecX family transcriptional regulator [Anaerolineae bacterium]